ncbi:IPT/TIG domain-containing protein [Nonomuraea sp. JJY05]|uniref:IPT/TIG domain-containing protein n=1 Tax=Nonomuraea sp. JJY05 TaxID=3350255 RepID=UPI00373F7D4B
MPFLLSFLIALLVPVSPVIAAAFSGPVITAVSPAAVQPGAEITITGSGFAPELGDNDVTINGNRAVPTSVSATELQVTVPVATTTGRLRVATPEGETTWDGDIVLPSPNLSLEESDGTARVAVGGTPQDVAITTPGNYAVAVFDAPVSGSVDLGLSGITTGYTHFRVYSPTAAQIDSDYAPVGSSLHFDGLTAGLTYQVLIDPAGASATGQVTVTASEPLNAGTAQTGDQSIVAAITRAGQRAVVSFDAEAGRPFELGLSDNTLTSYASLELFDPYGSERTGGNGLQVGDGNDISMPDPPYTGTYRVVISPRLAGTGSVTVTLSTPLEVPELDRAGAGEVITIARPGQSAVTTFTGASGDTVSLGMSANGFAQPLSVDIVAPDGTVIVNGVVVRAWSDDGVDVLKLPQTGTYQVTIDPARAAVGTVTATLSAPVRGTLTSTGNGTPITLSRPGQNGVLTFDGTASSHASIGLSGNTFAAPVLVSLLAPGATTPFHYFSLGVGQSGDIDLTAVPYNGPIRVVVNPQQAATGSLTVTLASPVDGGRLTTTGPGATLAVDRPGQDAVFTFVATAGDLITIGFSDSSLASSAQVDVIAPSGLNVVTDFYLGGEISKLSLPKLPATGIYRVVIDPFQANTGSLVATLSTAPLSVALTTTGPGTAVTVERPGQSAEATFTGTANTPVSLGVYANSMNHGVQISVFAPNGTHVQSRYFVPSRASGEIDIDRLPLSGTYRVVVEPEQSGTGALTLTLSERVTGGTLTLDGPVLNAAITRPGQDAEFSFAGTAAQKVRLKVAGASGFPERQFAVRVRKPDGTFLVSQNVTYDTPLNLPVLPSTGTYTVLIDPPQAGTGTVTLGLIT